jgi:hypothetical protein
MQFLSQNLFAGEIGNVSLFPVAEEAVDVLWIG